MTKEIFERSRTKEIKKKRDQENMGKMKNGIKKLEMDKKENEKKKMRENDEKHRKERKKRKGNK